MKGNRVKAQITIETVSAIAILLTLLLLVILININRETIASELNDVYIEANECNELALTISLLYSEGPYSKAEFSIDEEAQIESDYVIVGETRCDFPGRAQSTALNKGEVIARNTTGVVVLENT